MMTRRSTKTFALVAAAFSFLALEVSPAAAEDKFVTIGTAGVTGVYYPAGGAICRLLKRGRLEHGIRCVVESTGGSINNLELLRKGELEFGIVQSDMLYEAYNGSGIFYDVPPDKSLRAVFALHSEPFTVIARADAKINTFDDLKGKKVSLGATGSGARATMEDLMSKKGWTTKNFGAVVDVKANELETALCSKKIDAMIYSGGHPNGAVQQITSMCNTKLVSVEGETISKLIAEHPFYSSTVIPGKMYVNNPKDTKTFGVRAVLVAHEELDEDAVYEIVKSVFDNLDNFKTLHPVFASLEAKQMVAGGAVIPMHPGAIKYFREKGFID